MNADIIRSIEQGYQRELPRVQPGDEVALHLKVVEGGKERTQVFRGTVIAMRGSGNGATMTVRKISYGEGVERIVPLNSPNLKKLEVITADRARRAKLYHLRQAV